MHSHVQLGDAAATASQLVSRAHRCCRVSCACTWSHLPYMHLQCMHCHKAVRLPQPLLQAQQLAVAEQSTPSGHTTASHSARLRHVGLWDEHMRGARESSNDLPAQVNSRSKEEAEAAAMRTATSCSGDAGLLQLHTFRKPITQMTASSAMVSPIKVHLGMSHNGLPQH